jgi:hypothetical protein
LEARSGIEPPIRVLQTLALPLGDRATVPYISPPQLQSKLEIEPLPRQELAGSKAPVEWAVAQVLFRTLAKSPVCLPKNENPTASSLLAVGF